MPPASRTKFVEPVVCDTEGTISDNDSVIFFNFRPDRAREITRTLVDPDFDGFTVSIFPSPSCATRNMTPQCPMWRWPSPGVCQQWPWRISQSDGHDSAAHCRDGKIRTCDLLLQRRQRDGLPRRGPGADPSPKVATYDLQPEMSAPEVCENVWNASSPAPMTSSS